MAEENGIAVTTARALQEWRAAEQATAAAKSVVMETRSEISEADSDVAMMEVAEAEAHERYRDAYSKATDRNP
jgi:hypothetical protein